MFDIVTKLLHCTKAFCQMYLSGPVFFVDKTSVGSFIDLQFFAEYIECGLLNAVGKIAGYQRILKQLYEVVNLFLNTWLPESLVFLL